MKNLIYQLLLQPFKGSLFCVVFNFLERLKKKSVRRCSYSKSLSVYLLSDSISSIAFSRPSRIYRWMDGIGTKLRSLFIDYTGGNVKIEKGDIVIDCGANIGEFSIYCSSLGASVFAFEPDPAEFQALRANGQDRFAAFNSALWCDSNGITLFSANETGDSSAFQTSSATESFWVSSCTLDEFIQNKLFQVCEDTHIKLLKLEAEGGEPEILLGALNILDRIEYIAADLGPERGEQHENTVPTVVNLLARHGFEVVFYNPARSIFLFSNLRFSS